MVFFPKLEFLSGVPHNEVEIFRDYIGVPLFKEPTISAPQIWCCKVFPEEVHKFAHHLRPVHFSPQAHQEDLQPLGRTPEVPGRKIPRWFLAQTLLKGLLKCVMTIPMIIMTISAVIIIAITIIVNIIHVRIVTTVLIVIMLVVTWYC